MKLNSLNKNFALASVSLLALSTLAGFSGLATVNAKTTNVADQSLKWRSGYLCSISSWESKILRKITDL